MAEPWMGCWQEIMQDPDEPVVPYHITTVALRAQAMWIYTESHYLEVRVGKRRVLPAGWPPTEGESVQMFRTSSARAGRYWAEPAHEGWVLTHKPSLASDPRAQGGIHRHEVHLDGDLARVGDTARFVERSRWRRLSGPGAHELAGAWEQRDESEQWLYLVTAAHYGIVRSTLLRPAVHSPPEEFSDEEAAACYRTFGANAGAFLLATATFDHWPMISQTSGFETRKHETFHLRRVDERELVISLATDDEGTTWSRAR